MLRSGADLDPADSDAWYNKALSEEQAGRFREAARSFERLPLPWPQPRPPPRYQYARQRVRELGER